MWVLEWRKGGRFFDQNGDVRGSCLSEGSAPASAPAPAMSPLAREVPEIQSLQFTAPASFCARPYATVQTVSP